MMVLVRGGQLQSRGLLTRLDAIGPLRQVPHGQQKCRACQEALAERSLESPAVPAQPLQTPKKQPVPPTLITKTQAFDLEDDAWQNAALLIDKQRGWSSFDVCAKLRGMLKVGKKVGHAGTLDPSATGLLIVCVNKGTKSIDTFVGQEKEYTGAMRLGEATLSYDADLDVSERQPWEHITDDILQSVAKQFTGNLMQAPPMYSAVKVKGERLYHAARRGQVVERQARPIKVSALELRRSLASGQNVDFLVVCSKGTYIRSLVHDMGKSLGSAAHMTELRRTRIGAYHVNDAWTIEELQSAVTAYHNANSFDQLKISKM